MAKVKLLITAEYETRDRIAANATVARIATELEHQIQEGKMGHMMTGVLPGSVHVQIVEKSID